MKTLYKIGPRGGLVKLGNCPDNCGTVTILGRNPKDGERFLWGKGKNEDERRKSAREI